MDGQPVSRNDGMAPFELGMPSEALRLGGFENLPIRMEAHVLNKAGQVNHVFPKEKFLELPERLQNPIAVIDSKKRGDFVVLTEIKHGGENFVIAVTIHGQDGQLLINDITSFYPKHMKNLEDWAGRGRFRYYNRAKLRTFLAEQYGQKQGAQNSHARHQLPLAWTALLSDADTPTDAQVSQIHFATEAANPPAPPAASPALDAARAEETAAQAAPAASTLRAAALTGTSFGVRAALGFAIRLALPMLALTLYYRIRYPEGAALGMRAESFFNRVRQCRHEIDK